MSAFALEADPCACLGEEARRGGDGVRIHQALRVTPAMIAGVSKMPWTMDDVVRVVEEWEDSRETASGE